MSGMLNVRSQPALKAPSVGSKKTDAVVECFELREEWIRISPEGQKPKWVRAWYLSEYLCVIERNRGELCNLPCFLARI